MFKLLEQRPGHDWRRFPVALSSRSGQAVFHITNSDNSNSLQIPLVGVKVTGEITVPTLRLDEFWIRESLTAKNVFLKIDTEGHDLEVVKGASGILDRVSLIMVETAPIPRYQGEPALPGRWLTTWLALDSASAVWKKTHITPPLAWIRRWMLFLPGGS